MFIDTHAHLCEEEFKMDVEQVIADALEAGATKIFIPATNEASAIAAAELCKGHPGTLHPMIGLHPEDVKDDYRQVLQDIEKHLQQPSHPFIAIGEVGLDFYWDDTYKEEQTDAFHIQTEWALKYNLPLMIHARSAHKELTEALKPYKDDDSLRGVFHCFTGTPQEALELLSTFPRFALGIGGVLTFKKSTLPETLRSAVPLERIVLETDSPYMAPVPHRGKRNEPSFIPAIIERMADIYATTPSAIGQTTTSTALRIFQLSKTT